MSLISSQKLSISEKQNYFFYYEREMLYQVIHMKLLIAFYKPILLDILDLYKLWA